MSDQIVPGAGPEPAPGPPGRPTLTALRAAADQHQAELRDLVQLVRDHVDVHDCAVTGLPCPGELVLEQLLDMGCADRVRLLALALVELSALGYGLPTTAADAYWPADPAGGS